MLKNQLPTNVVPNSAVERMLTINGEVLGDVLSVMHDPEGLRQLVHLPAGSAEAELSGLLPLVHVYRYLETTSSWDVLGADVHKNSAELSRKIREDVLNVNRLTALVLKTLSTLDPLVPVDHQALSLSVSWLIRSAQLPDGSFSDASSFRPNRLTVAGSNAIERSVYLTSFVLIGLFRATSIRDKILQLRFHDDSIRSAANYISHNAPGVKSVYVRAVATYALTLHDPSSMAASQLLSVLETLARQKGHPAVLRYWQESSVTADWLNPDQSSGLTVETTAYVLLTVLLKDTVLTLEALTEYSRTVPRAVLNQDISLSYSRKGFLGRVQLSQSRPVATPIQVTQDDDITASTGYGRGVSTVKFRDAVEPLISHYELQGNTVVVQLDTVPSDVFLCVGFRVRTGFRVSGAGESLFSIYEPQDKGSVCTRTFSSQEQKLQRLCVGEECQCMTAACSAYRGTVDPTLTVAKRLEETCRPHVRYEFEAVSSGTEVELVKKATCSSVDVQNQRQYLVMGASGSEVTLSHGFRYRLPLDAEAVVELWPTDCTSPGCGDYVSQLEDLALELQLSSCPVAS
ncbi:hypothetical protein F2P81_025147 [Scophthalmus maximus]|uniref:Alpha-macroglobulin receptor-binding domain-containing protein n=1 Tax=Scophthalmus maximus TaxID=52904 RepID=A0A6A4RTI1_SCOMX|nr:hypothetical protein F2P81_025147 [Scophthalmus maximus]